MRPDGETERLREWKIRVKGNFEERNIETVRQRTVKEGGQIPVFYRVAVTVL